MKSLVLLDSISRQGGGLLGAELGLQQALAEAGIVVSIGSLRDAHTESDLALWQPLAPRSFEPLGPAAVGVSPALRQWVMEQEADIIYRAGLWRMPSKYAHEWAGSRHKPGIVAPHGMLDPWAVRNSRWKKRIASMLFEATHLRSASCIRALCEAEAQAVRGYGLKNPVAITPNGIELPEKSEGEKREAVSGRKTLLFLGRIHPKKGLINALRAWKAGSGMRDAEEWQFVIAGWDQGGHEAELKRLCDELGLAYADVPAAEFVGREEELSVVGCRLSEVPDVGASQSASSSRMAGSRLEQCASSRTTDNRQQTTDHNASVFFTGPAFGDEKDRLLRKAAAFILPSFSEGLPMAVLEAWAYRLPVLMTDHCNLPEGFAADAALRIDTDTESIAEGLRHLFTLPTTDNGQPTTSLASIGANGRELVERQFTWPQVAAQMKEVYEWVLGGGAKPECVVE